MSPFHLTRTLAEDAADAALRADVLRGLGLSQGPDASRAEGTPALKTLRPSGSTTPTAATCSRRSPSCPSTTATAPSGRS